MIVTYSLSPIWTIVLRLKIFELISYTSKYNFEFLHGLNPENYN